MLSAAEVRHVAGAKRRGTSAEACELVNLAADTLEELGYVAVGFTSGTAALAVFRADRQRFDVVITDERMPQVSGETLVKEVRPIQNTRPVILMSGFVGGGLMSRARTAGADEVLKKPLLARDLATSLARVLAHWRYPG